MSGIGKRIVNLRENKKWTQRELARRVDLNFSVMNRIESGDRPVRDVELRDLADVLGVTTDYLLGRTDIESGVVNKTDAFEEFIKDPELRRWHKELPKSDEEDLKRLRRIWEAYKNED